MAYLKISRLSNLPTVWSNCLAGTALGENGNWQLALLSALALSCYYIAGMWLNDACDNEIDAVKRPMRPIPCGEITTKEAMVVSLALLVLANVLLISSGYLVGAAPYPLLGFGAFLSLCIIAYNRLHKIFSGAVLIMALCRWLIYVIAAQMAKFSPKAWIAGALLACYIVGLTCIAREETRLQLRGKWPLLLLFAPFCYILPVPGSFFTTIAFFICLAWVSFCTVGLITTRLKIATAVAMLIAGISLWDALLLFSLGNLAFAAFAVLCFPLTLVAHRFIAGT